MDNVKLAGGIGLASQGPVIVPVDRGRPSLDLQEVDKCSVNKLITSEPAGGVNNMR